MTALTCLQGMASFYSLQGPHRLLLRSSTDLFPSGRPPGGRRNASPVDERVPGRHVLRRQTEASDASVLRPRSIRPVTR